LAEWQAINIYGLLTRVLCQRAEQQCNIGSTSAVAAHKRLAFMIQEELRKIVCCPEDHSALTPANDALVAQLNAAIRAGRLRNEAGRTVEQTIDGGLVRAAGDLLYPIVDQIPVLLKDEAIRLDQL
jgi:uncharacterized protein YbaR (Trm112 family)